MESPVAHKPTFGKPSAQGLTKSKFGNIVPSAFTPELSKHSKSFSLIDCVSVLAALAPQIPFSSVNTMMAGTADSLWQERLLALLGLVFSVMSVLMVLIRLYSFAAMTPGNGTASSPFDAL